MRNNLQNCILINIFFMMMGSVYLMQLVVKKLSKASIITCCLIIFISFACIIKLKKTLALIKETDRVCYDEQMFELDFKLPEVKIVDEIQKDIPYSYVFSSIFDLKKPLSPISEGDEDKG